MILIPYKVLGDHKNHIRHEETSHVEGTIHTCGGTIQYLFCIRYGDHKELYSKSGDHTYMWRTIQYLFHISLGGPYVHEGTL